ncbi:hypothetical protein O7635_18000 [Asanoa sp. WMMD1127]|uniref:hypothetical protein n=1 Tax=Asanoa sp. WMMD1127 TaxID=3016107 RepID=UPI0024167B4E|nr:hypothetical protein [Asanoa sp. WMMD1127]MDG4823751.1 hypothetical protein [Asanoa sp. WMMD1127]
MHSRIHGRLLDNMDAKKRTTRVAIVCAAPIAIALMSTGTAYAASPPGVPEAERLSNGTYEANQFCDAGRPLVTSSSPVLSASPTTPQGATHPPFAPYPGLSGTFEVATAAGNRVVRASTPILNGRVFVFQVPAGKITSGDYRFRVRAQNSSTASAWTPWCSFTVSSPR